MDQSLVSIEKMKLLHQLTIGILGATGLQDCCDITTRTIVQEMQLYSCSLFTISTAHKQLNCLSYCINQTNHQETVKGLRSMAVGTGVVGQCALLEKTLVISDVSECEFYIDTIKANQSELAVPILKGDELLGVLVVGNEKKHYFDSSIVSWFEQYADLLALVMEQHLKADNQQIKIEGLQRKMKSNQDSSELYEGLISQAADAFYYHKPNGQIIDVNQQAVMLLGYSKAELLNMSVQKIDLKLIHDPQRLKNIYRKLKPGEPIVSLSKHCRKDGSVFPVEVSIGLLDSGNVLAIVRDISKRAGIQAELDKTKDFISEIVNTSPNIIYIYDYQKNKVVFGAKRIAKLFGYPDKAIYTWQSIIRYTASDQKEVLKKRFKEIFNSTNSSMIETEIKFIHHTGREVWIQNFCKIVERNTDGTPRLEVGTLNDISTIKSIQQSLISSESYYRALVKNAYDAILLYDGDGSILYASDSIYRMLEIEVNDSKGKTPFDYVSAEDVEAVEKSWQWVKANPNQPHHIQECRLRKSDGSFIWVEATLTNLIEDPNIKGIVSNIRDISFEVNARHESEKREVYFRSLVDNAFDGIVLYNIEGNIQFVSGGAKRLLGYDKENLLYKRATEFIYPEDLALIKKGWEWVLKNPGVSYQLPEYRLQKKNGEIIWVENSLLNLLDNKNVNGVISNFHDISHKKQAEHSIYRIANYDTFTELPNRHFLKRHLQQLIEKSNTLHTNIALIYFDIAKLNSINNALGHDTGDKVIKHLSNTIEARVQPFDFIARSGNDEFAIVLVDCPPFKISKLCQEILLPYAEVINLSEHEVKITINAGVAIYPSDATSSDELINKAEIAVKRAKIGSESLVFFQRHDSDLLNYNISLESELHSAIHNDDLQLFFQPIIDVDTGKIVSLEALLRWENANKVNILPSIIIRIAEESELIHKITKWVINAAVKQLQQWLLIDPNIKISINLSAKDIQKDGLDTLLISTLAKHQIPSRNLDIEITESAAISDLSKSIKILTNLSKSGICISLDDFGTGYSSISHLTQLPVDTVKIDRSFVKDLSGEKNDPKLEVLNNIIQLARSFNKVALVEGIEKVSQFEALKGHQGLKAQGYLFSRPKPVEEVEKLLKQGLIKR